MKEFNKEKEAERVIDVLFTALARDPGTQIEYEPLKKMWCDYLESVYTLGILSGLGMAKSAWDKGLGREDIYENEIYYKEVLKT